MNRISPASGLQTERRETDSRAPYICGEIASEILGGKTRLPKRFKPSRKLISYKTAKEAIEDSVTADFGGEVQHALNLPPYAVESYREMKRAKIKKIYELRKIENFGIHPELPRSLRKRRLLRGLPSRARGSVGNRHA